jgi:hypothetical protein
MQKVALRPQAFRMQLHGYPVQVHSAFLRVQRQAVQALNFPVLAHSPWVRRHGTGVHPQGVRLHLQHSGCRARNSP